MACVLVTAPSFSRADKMCFVTVGFDMPRIVAISQSVLPSAAQSKQSCSRGDKRLRARLELQRHRRTAPIA